MPPSQPYLPDEALSPHSLKRRQQRRASKRKSKEEDPDFKRKRTDQERARRDRAQAKQHTAAVLTTLSAVAQDEHQLMLPGMPQPPHVPLPPPTLPYGLVPPPAPPPQPPPQPPPEPPPEPVVAVPASILRRLLLGAAAQEPLPPSESPPSSSSRPAWRVLRGEPCGIHAHLREGGLAAADTHLREYNEYVGRQHLVSGWRPARNVEEMSLRDCAGFIEHLVACRQD